MLVGSFKTNEPSNVGSLNALGFTSFVGAADHVDAMAEGNSDGRTSFVETVSEKAMVPVLEDAVVLDDSGTTSFLLGFLWRMPLE